MTTKHFFIGLAAVSAMALSGCQLGKSAPERQVLQEVTGTVNPYLWRATLDTFKDLPVETADPLGGIVAYDWKSFDGAPNERVKAQVYLLDTRLRADGVKVQVFRQTNQSGQWVDASVDPDTGIQLENQILARARTLKASRLN